MKTLTYRLYGRPAGLDDLLDRAKDDPGAAVGVELGAELVIQEMRVFRQLLGTFTWRFEDGQVVCQKVFGNIPSDYGAREAAGAVARANRRLAQYLHRIRSAGVRAAGLDKRFEIGFAR